MSEVTRLGVPDILHWYGSLSAADMVTQHGIQAEPQALHRALRACAALGIFTEDESGKFGPTPLSHVLTKEAPGTLKRLVQYTGNLLWRVWTGLPEGLHTGRPQARNQLGAEFFDYLTAHPDEMQEFGDAMESLSANVIRGVLASYDFSRVNQIVDVGGGFGHLITALLEKYSHLKGVLLDAPDVIATAKGRLSKSPIASRLEFASVDMFQSMPPADAYILKMIIHDWSDAQCIRLLCNCRENMRGDGRVICVDAVLPPLGDTSDAPGKLLDLNMLLVLPGKERTRAEWEFLYWEAGLEIASIRPIPDAVGTNLVEGVKCRS
jgi:hypothetical protein